MADIKRKFRAEDGLDAGGDKIINMALADRTVGTEGVNVDFLVQENTVQLYDPTRGYLKDFIVLSGNRLWVAQLDTPVPAGPFNDVYWKSVRTDPNWEVVGSGSYNLKSGDSISVDTATGSDMVFTLPGAPLDGDTIVLKDIGGLPGYTEVVINASVQSIVNGRGTQVRTIKMTHPRSEMVFVFSNRLWYLYISDYERKAISVTPAAIFEAQANDFITRRFTSGEPIHIKLPKHANHGDMINITDLDGLNPLYHTIYTTYDTNTSVNIVGQHSLETRTTGDGFLVFDSSENLWRAWYGDLRSRLRIITTDTKIRPNDHIMVFGSDNATPGSVLITLPTDVALGDTVKISLNYIRKGQTVTIRASTGDTIATDMNLLQFPKRSSYPPDTEWALVSELVFNGSTSYVPVLELSYIEDTSTGKKHWVVAQNVPTVERVDSLSDATRTRVGVIALANQNQANIDHENNPEKELAITPQTLANRVATEARRGIARIATTAQVNQITEFAYQDDLIISPKKLNEKQATEAMRGLAEIATQAETNTGTDDLRIVTPKKLNERKSSETLTGILALTSTVGTVPAASRAVLGTNVYNSDENTKAVTPKSLAQYKANQVQQGVVYLSNQNEVNAGQTASGFANGAVSPETLHARVALDNRTGLIEIATQTETDAGTDYTRAVTPKTLNDRNATQTLTGIARIGTQVEFDAGLLDNVISTPLKVKTRFDDTARTSVSAASGLIETGTLWNHYTLDIQEASNTQRGTARLATQTEVNAGTDDKTIITPLKLQAKKATEIAEGIVQLSTQAETVAGTIDNKAISPKNLKFIAQQEVSWESTETRRGFVRLTAGVQTFAGNKTTGSGIKFDSTASDGYGYYVNDDDALTAGNYFKSGFTLSPYELNRTLQNFLPVNATAVNSHRLDDLDSLQFIRRDIDQTVNGSLTLTKQLNLAAPLVSSSSSEFTTVLAKDSITIGDGTKSTLVFDGPSNNWDVKTASSVLSFNAVGTNENVLKLERTGNIAVLQSLSAGNRIDASKGFSVEGGIMVLNPSAAELKIGTQSKKTSIEALDADTFTVTDPSGSYNVLSTKNAQTILNPTYVRRDGSSMTGNLAINATLAVQIPEGSVITDLSPSNTNANSWTSVITDPTIYKKLPALAIPVFGFTADAPDNKFVVRYSQMFDSTGTGLNVYHSSGVLSQHGIGTKNVYQIWSVDLVANWKDLVKDINGEPVVVPDGFEPSSMYMRQFNQTLNKWGTWSRMMTTNSPPLASEIGAASTIGSEFGNLRIRDWLQIGNVRITPNPITQSVDFTWVE